MVSDCSTTSTVLPVLPWLGTSEISTAITKVAPICLARLTGTGLTSPPSTYSAPEMATGRKITGTLLDALTAVPVSPVLNTTASPVESRVATAPNLRLSFSMG
jgi:hypothetical protein